MRTRLALLSLLLLLPVGCGDTPGEASTQQATLEAVLDAIRAKDGATLLTHVDVPAKEAADPRAISGVEETLRQLDGVEFTLRHRSGKFVAPDAPDRMTVQLRKQGALGTPKEFGFAFVQSDDVWRVTKASMMGFLRSALTVATGQSPMARQTQMALSYLTQAIALFKVDSGTLPDDLSVLAQPGRGGEPYLSAIPRDNWGQAYHYEVKADGAYDLRSAGPDGQPNTDDDVLPNKR